MAFGNGQLGSAQYGGSLNAVGPYTVYINDTVVHVETETPTLIVPVTGDVVTHVQTFKVQPELREVLTHTERPIASLNGTPWDLLWTKIAKTATTAWTKIAKP